MYKYAIIGFGGLGKLHMTNLHKLEQVRGDLKLQALCATSAAALNKNVELNLGTVDMGAIDLSKCNFYTDYKELLDKEELDFVVSALPTYMHEEVAVYALNKGVHVLSEKPMALTAEGCERMLEAAKNSGKKLMIGQCLRFDPAVRKLKEYIDNETFGKPYRAEFSRYSQVPTWSSKNWIIDPERSGGCVFDMHIHDVDLINWMFGTPNAVRSAVTSVKVGLEAIFTQYFYDDLLVTSNADWSMPAKFPFEARSLVNFTGATVILQGGKLTVYTDTDTFSPELPEVDAFMAEMQTFLKAAFDGEDNEDYSAESVYNSVKLALIEIESSKDLSTVKIK